MAQFDLKLLEFRLKTLRGLLATTVPNTPEWRKYKKAIDECNAEINAIIAK